MLCLWKSRNHVGKGRSNMPQWLPWLIAFISLEVFIALWFWEVNREMLSRKSTVESARAQLAEPFACGRTSGRRGIRRCSHAQREYFSAVSRSLQRAVSAAVDWISGASSRIFRRNQRLNFRDGRFMSIRCDIIQSKGKQANLSGSRFISFPNGTASL